MSRSATADVIFNDRMGAGQVQAPSISLSPLLRKSTPTGGPLQPALLKLVLDFLFPDSNPASNPYPETLQLPAYATHFYETSSTKTAKTTPPDSLVWRLAVAAACCLQWAGASGVAHLLHEFAMELRWAHPYYCSFYVYCFSGTDGRLQCTCLGFHLVPLIIARACSTRSSSC